MLRIVMNTKRKIKEFQRKILTIHVLIYSYFYDKITVMKNRFIPTLAITLSVAVGSSIISSPNIALKVEACLDSPDWKKYRTCKNGDFQILIDYPRDVALAQSELFHRMILTVASESTGVIKGIYIPSQIPIQKGDKVGMIIKIDIEDKNQSSHSVHYLLRYEESFRNEKITPLKSSYLHEAQDQARQIVHSIN